jgi:hypothetical protein
MIAVTQLGDRLVNKKYTVVRNEISVDIDRKQIYNQYTFFALCNMILLLFSII